MSRRSCLVLSILLAAAVGGCSTTASTVSMKIGDRVFNLEVAATQAVQEKGLMNRDSMPPDHGMIFVFDEEREYNFWMKNTRIPLDIIYLNHTGRVVSIHQMVPFSWENVPSDYPATYAIELNRGAADAAHVSVGDVLQIPAAARSKVQ